MIEEWRDIPGFEGLYKIDISTPDGKCWSMYSNKYLSNKKGKEGRIYWGLSKDGKHYRNQAARWIAMTYPELVQNEYFEGAEIDHIIPLSIGGSNHPSNLRWVTTKENRNNPLTRRHNKEKQHAKPVIQYTLKGEWVKEYPSAHEAERQTGIDKGSIGRCCKGLYKSSGTLTGPKYIWKYKEQT